MSASKYKSWFGIPDGTEASRCFYPARIDTFGNGCSHDCVYCYVKNMLDFRNYWNIESPSVADTDEIRRSFVTAFETDRKSVRYDIIRKRIPVRLGGLTDPLQPAEEGEAATFRLLKILREFQYPYLLLTKSALVGTDAYISVMDKDISSVQISVTTLDDELAELVEPMAPKPVLRLNAMRNVSNAGIFVSHRISPLVFPFPDGYLSSGAEYKDPILPYFTPELVQAGCEYGSRLTLIEFLRFLPYTMKWARDVFPGIGGFDWCVGPMSVKESWAKHYSLPEKLKYVAIVKAICDSNGVPISICDDKHYEELRPFWSNQEDCCGLLGSVPGFTRSYKERTD